MNIIKSFFAKFKPKPQAPQVCEIKEQRISAAHDYVPLYGSWGEIENLLRLVLSDIDNEVKEKSSYIAGTLCLPYHGKIILLNFGKNPDETEVLLAKCFLKYKSPTSAYYCWAMAIVEGDEKIKKEFEKKER